MTDQCPQVRIAELEREVAELRAVIAEAHRLLVLAQQEWLTAMTDSNPVDTCLHPAPLVFLPYGYIYPPVVTARDPNHCLCGNWIHDHQVAVGRTECDKCFADANRKRKAAADLERKAKALGSANKRVR